jgi:hypothetical protein
MRMSRSVILLLLVLSPLAAAESLYKCDANGAITIQSDPCPSGSTEVWRRDATPEAGPSAEELAARAALAAAEAQRLAESARLAEQQRIAELLRRDDEIRLRAAEASGSGSDSVRPERKSECTQAHEFSDAAHAKEWLNLSQTQRDRLRSWVIEQCKDPRGRPVEGPVTL